MKQVITYLKAGALAGATLLGTGCASSYTAIRPERVAYQSVANGPLQLGYQHDALRLNGRNKKYVKRQNKKGYQVVAVQLKNTTGTDINFTRDAVLYNGDRPVQPVPSAIAAQDMKQGVAIYLLYVLLNFNVGGTTTTNYTTGQTTTTGGTFIPTGPFIAGGNMLGASLANKNFREELAKYDLTNRVIHPGETVYGIVCLRDYMVSPLRVELRTVAATTPAPASPLAAPAASPAPAPATDKN